MSKGDTRREAELANLEAEFAEALAEARKAEVSAYIAEKEGRQRGAATQLDVKLFTLESKIERLRERLGLPAFAVPLRKPEPKPDPDQSPWDPPPDLDGSVYPLHPARFWHELVDSGRKPSAVFSKVKCMGGKGRQSPEAPTWRLCTVECSAGRIPANVTLTVLPLPEGADALAATKKLDGALTKLVTFAEHAMNTRAEERPRLLVVSYTRATRELQFGAR